MSTIKFKNYDEAYSQTEKVYKSIQKDGTDIVLNLKKICDGLKEKWHGEDAPIHINALANIQSNLKKYFTSSVSMIVEVSDRVVAIQKTAEAISNYNNVGANLKDEFDGTDDSEEALSKRSYKLESLKDEYDLLDNTIVDFVKFKNAYAVDFENFFDNWEDDPRKERIEGIFDDFISKLDEYLQTMDSVRQELGKAVVNAEQILE